MRRIIGFIVVLLLGVPVDIQAQPPQPENGAMSESVRDLEQSVRSFVLTLNRSKLSSLQWSASAIVGADPDNPHLNEIQKELIKRRGGSRYSVSQIRTVIEGESARVIYDLTLTDSLSGRMVQTEELSFKRGQTPNGLGWKIVPGQPEKVVGDDSRGILLHFATLIAYPRKVLALSRAYVSSSNLKQLSLGLFMLAQDYDEQYAIDNVEFKEKLLPYTAGEQVFYSPADNSGRVSYSFNDNLTGIKWNRAANLESTILLYEGQGGELAFRHDGRALVGLTNDVVKFVTPEEAKALHWEP